jgi:hypothetical protein
MKAKNKRICKLIATSAVGAYSTLLYTGCGALSLLKASEAPDYGFVKQPELMTEQPDKRPFNKSWIAGAEYKDAKAHKKGMYIAPVSISILEKRYQEEIEDEEVRQIQIEEAQELAQYFENRIKVAHSFFENHPLPISESKSPDDLTVELALVELDPTSPIVNVIGTAAGYFVPGGGLIKIVGKGEIAMEGMICDAQTGSQYERFKDREEDKASAFSIRDFQRYAHLRAAIDDWSSQILEILSKSPDESVEDSLPFTLNPF